MTRRIRELAIACCCLGACDPYSALRVRQALHPVPSETCLEARVTASSLVREIDPKWTGPEHSFQVMVRDTLARDGVWPAIIALGAPPDSAHVLSVEFGWMGSASRFSDAEKRRMRLLGDQLLAELRATCQSAPAGEIERVEAARARPRPCPPAT